MGRCQSLLVALWAVIAAPALCLGGVLLHECECGSAQTCAHEGDCASDPCGALTVRTPRPIVVGSDEATMATHVATAPSDFLGTDPLASLTMLPAQRPSVATLPFPPSDRPLRI
ncbi:MAG: hypothetical protein IH940_09995 [Acidobacteria bacterium]|nr:hypothetical protein [Acidobacteriota bacterium]